MDRARGCRAWAAAGLVMAASIGLPRATEGQETPATATRPVELRFLDGLRERGYSDLALDYLDELRRDAAAPAELKSRLDFEEGRGLLEEAKFAADLQRREQLFSQARTRLESFVKANPDSPETLEARVLLAQLLYQRGQTEALKANEAPTDTEKEARRREARASFEQSRIAFDQALDPLQKSYDTFPTGFLEESDPKRAGRDAAHIRLMDAALKRALVDYEEAQTHPPGAEPRNQLLDAAIGRFKTLNDKYRDWMAGVAAYMWMGKCYEERGDVGSAIGIYKDLLEEANPSRMDPGLFPLRRQVAFFKIIAHGKRGEYPLAERLAREWLDISRGDEGTYERLGVQLELARSLDQQIEERKFDAQHKKAAIDLIVQQLGEVVKVVSPFKPDAVTLLRKYRPAGAVDPRALAGLNFDQAMERGREAMGIEEWDTAATYFSAAAGRVNTTRQPDRANEARYLLAFAHYQARRYYESAVLASFLATSYPKWENSPKAAELAMSAMALAYEDLPGAGRERELTRLDEFARKVEEIYADQDQSDVARVLRGDIALGQGRYEDAAAIFESVKGESHRLDAQGKAAASHWRNSLVLRKQADTSGSLPPAVAEESSKARTLLEGTLEARKAAQIPSGDPALLSNVGDLAEIHVAENRPDEALALLEPANKELSGSTDDATRPIRSRLMKLQLQAHIAAGRTDEAVADMKALEQASNGEPLTQLFFGLGRLLEDEMEAMTARGDRVALERTRAAYTKFLDALVASPTGQSFESLQWAGGAMIEVGKPDRALEIFDRILKDYPDHQHLDLTKLRRVTALRKAGKFNDAWKDADRLVKANPRNLSYLEERCLLLEDWARAEKGRWNTAIKYWQDLAKMMERQHPRPPEFFDAWYHVAWCYHQSGNDAYAKRTLKSLMAVSDSLGSPEIKSKFESLLKKLGA